MHLTCNNCKYKWDYQGNNEYYATCPHCLRKVKVKTRKGGKDAKS